MFFVDEMIFLGLSNGKKKGQGNTKNGNKYLAWAFVEAANFAIRFNEQAKRFYQRKAAKGNRHGKFVLPRKVSASQILLANSGHPTAVAV